MIRFAWPVRLALSVSVATAMLVLFAGLTHAGDDGGRAWRAPARAANLKNPMRSDAASLAAGKAMYTRECASCHGDAGKGNGPDAADLSRPPADFAAPTVAAQSDGELFWKMTEGRKPMPRYARTLRDEERWHVVNYIRSLRPKPK